MIEFTTNVFDLRFAQALGKWTKEKNIEHELIPFTGCLIHKMHRDDFQDFLYDYFNVKVDA